MRAHRVVAWCTVWALLVAAPWAGATDTFAGKPSSRELPPTMEMGEFETFNKLAKEAQCGAEECVKGNGERCCRAVHGDFEYGVCMPARATCCGCSKKRCCACAERGICAKEEQGCNLETCEGCCAGGRLVGVGADAAMGLEGSSPVSRLLYAAVAVAILAVIAKKLAPYAGLLRAK